MELSEHDAIFQHETNAHFLSNYIIKKIADMI